jgi:hypothetical protein
LVLLQTPRHEDAAQSVTQVHAHIGFAGKRYARLTRRRAPHLQLEDVLEVERVEAKLGGKPADAHAVRAVAACAHIVEDIRH